jgi:hypothetical protein
VRLCALAHLHPQNGDFGGIEWSDRLQTVPIDSTRGYCIPIEYEDQRATLKEILGSKLMIFRILAPPESFSTVSPLESKSGFFVAKNHQMVFRCSQLVVPMGTASL